MGLFGCSILGMDQAGATRVDRSFLSFESGCAPRLARHATLAARQRNGVVPKASAGTSTSLVKVDCPTSSHSLTSRLRACGPDSHWKTDWRSDRQWSRSPRRDIRYLTVSDFA